MQNAFTREMMDDFEKVWLIHNTQTVLTLSKVYPLFDVDERVKVIVLTGAGRTFCAGADLERGFKGGEERVMDHRDGHVLLNLKLKKCKLI